MAELTLVEAVNRALAHALEHDPDVLLLGEDIGVNGGVFRATLGLQQRFGSERVIDTPLAEAAIAGVAVGMAAMGLKPVMEIQFTGFIYPAIDQLINHASRLRNRTRGRLTCPMVLRSPYGARHSCARASFRKPRGACSRICRACASSFRPRPRAPMACCSPRFAIPIRSYSSSRRGSIACSSKRSIDDGESLPLDTCFVSREGRDVTLVAWGAMLHEALAAAE